MQDDTSYQPVSIVLGEFSDAFTTRDRGATRFAVFAIVVAIGTDRLFVCIVTTRQIMHPFRDALSIQRGTAMLDRSARCHLMLCSASMTTPTNCYPWWHAKFAPLRAKPIYVRSGCAIDGNGNVACAPEAMRANAEQQLRAGGYLSKLSLETYTLARYMQGEVGGGHGAGTLEEAVAVGEAAVNRARVEGRKDANAILLYRQGPGHPNYGFYGPIHGGSGTGSAPYGRWATTHTDPTVLACLLAELITSGQSDNFNRGADDQAGLQYAVNFPSVPGAITTWANRGQFWVGPLPGVDHWRTFLVQQKRGETARSPWGATWVKYCVDYLNEDMAANGGARKMRQPWPANLPTCSRGGGLLAVAGIIGATAGALVVSARTAR